MTYSFKKISNRRHHVRPHDTCPCPMSSLFPSCRVGWHFNRRECLIKAINSFEAMRSKNLFGLGYVMCHLTVAFLPLVVVGESSRTMRAALHRRCSCSLQRVCTCSFPRGRVLVFRILVRILSILSERSFRHPIWCSVWTHVAQNV